VCCSKADDARKLTLTLQELQGMMSAVVAEAIQRTRHMTDADAEVNSLSAGRSGSLGNTDDQGREAVVEDRRNSDARPRSRIRAFTFTSRRTRGCGDKGEPDACGDGSKGCSRLSSRQNCSSSNSSFNIQQERNSDAHRC